LVLFAIARFHEEKEKEEKIKKPVGIEDKEKKNRRRRRKKKTERYRKTSSGGGVILKVTRIFAKLANGWSVTNSNSYFFREYFNKYFDTLFAFDN